MKEIKKHFENIAIKGEHHKFCFREDIIEGTELFKQLVNAVQDFVQRGKDDMLDFYTKLGLISNYQVGHNIIPTSGRTILARLLTGDTYYSGEINYGALGDATDAFTNASVKLGNELYRKIASSQSYNENIAYIDFFIASGDVADQTFEEWGTFIDGTITPDSGQAFSLYLTSGWVKSGSMYISSKYTIS
jgi:hypothetical protein